MDMESLRDYQSAAVEAAVAALAGGGRAQVHAACGTGKSLMTIHAATRLAPPDGVVVVAVPSLALITQLLRVWAEQGPPHEALTVCGDPTVRDSVAHLEDLQDLPARTTTDESQIAAWVEATAGLRLILTTHLSAVRVGEGLRQVGRAADVLVVDEAHRVAGRAAKTTAGVHSDAVLPAARRLYVTATPRVGIGRTVDAGEEALSMDNEGVFGPVVSSYPFARAIAEGWLDDYRVAVIGVSRQEVLQVLRDARPDAAGDSFAAPLRVTALQAALLSAARDLDLRRVLVFAPRIADSREFALTLPRTAAAHPAAPERPLTSWHVDGTMSSRQREIFLRDLADPPGDGWAVLANARCLTEGVDIPAVDAVVFTAPKSSQVDVVQSVGRALRRNPEGGGVATVLIPILLPEDPEQLMTGEDEQQWETLWQVLRALRAHDTTLAAELDRTATRGRDGNAPWPTRLLVRLPEELTSSSWLDAIRVRIVEGGASVWARSLARAVEYHAAHGRLDPPGNYRSPDGFHLGRWCAARRDERRRGLLPADRVAELDALGMRWDNAWDLAWTRNVAALEAFVREHGHLRIPFGYVQDDVNLTTMLTIARRKVREGSLAEPVRTAMEDLGFVWDPGEWATGYADLLEWHAAHGHLQVPQTHQGRRIKQLAGWLQKQRIARRGGELSDEQVAALERLGIDWEPYDTRWERGVAALRAYVAAHGTADVPMRHITDDGMRLGSWLVKARMDRKRGQLPPGRVAQLEALGVDWDPAETEWQAMLGRVREYAERHGTARVPARHVSEDGIKLGSWLANQRAHHRGGRMPAERAQLLRAAGALD